VRIERCEGVQLIAAAARIIVSSCHDCILHLGINRAPLLIGDNRFLQVLPYKSWHGHSRSCLCNLIPFVA
jgi:Tubulin binding cofactor C